MHALHRNDELIEAKAGTLPCWLYISRAGLIIACCSWPAPGWLHCFALCLLQLKWFAQLNIISEL